MHSGNAIQSERVNPIRNWNGGKVNAILRGVSVSEAEHALANVWRRVEEYGADAPRMRFCFRRDGSISIQFSFANQAVAAFVLNGLETTCRPDAGSGRAR